MKRFLILTDRGRDAGRLGMDQRSRGGPGNAEEPRGLSAVADLPLARQLL